MSVDIPGAPSEAEAMIGRVVAEGRYQIVKLLGEGGMGAVYQAKQVAMDRMVALKLIRAEVVKSPDAVARFYREMKITAKIEHANTIRVYDFGETDGQLFLTMELLKGQTLKKALETGGKMPLDRIVHITTQILRALSAAHGEGVVHRDLKPDNVMLLEQYGEKDVVKVLDFGIAKSLEDTDSPQMTAAGAVIGTPVYMSAEQAMGQKVDTRADLYSLGVMLFEMASGRVPFVAPTLNALLVAHAVEAPPPLLEVAPDANPQLAQLIAQMLEKNPASRPQTAKEVEQRLASLAGGVGLTIPPTRLGMEPPPSRTGLYAAVAAAVVLAAGGGGFFVYKSRQGGGDGKPKPLSAAEQKRLDAVTKQLAAKELPPIPPTCEGAAETGELVLRAQDELTSNEAHAMAMAQDAIKRCSNWAVPHNVLGQALQRASRATEGGTAADSYARALTFAPTWDAPRFNLGLLQVRAKDPAAISTLTELIRRRPDYPKAFSTRAQAYFNDKRIDEALGDLDEAVKRDPKDATAWFLMGNARAGMKRADANEAFCKASELGFEKAAALCKK